MVLVNNGNFTGALDYLHRAQEIMPEYPELLINLAIAESLTKQSAAAEQHFKEALRLAPSFPDSYSYYARYLLSNSRADEARALLQRVLELSPADLTARELLKQADLADLASPTQEHGVVYLGHSEEKKKDGNPESYVRQKFKCGNEHDKWCTIHLVISFYRADNERLKITLTSEGDNKKSVFLNKETTIDPNTPKPQRFAVSVKGCNECELRIEITEGDTKNIQSSASIALSNIAGPSCTDGDITGGEDTIDLVNEQGQNVQRRGSTEYAP
jgi:tetratricopeptide (TPR) repeat protein